MPLPEDRGPFFDALREVLSGVEEDDRAPSWGEDDPFAGIVGALLLDASADRRLAILAALREEGFLTPETLARAEPRELADALSEHKLTLAASDARPLQRVARLLAERYGGSAEALGLQDTETLREELGALNGVGPAAVDRVLLYGLARPTYPLDRASYRIAVRHGWFDATAEAEEARSVLVGLGDHDPTMLMVMHEAYDAIGRRWCKPSVPRCETCPLRPFLPHEGPLEP